MDVARPDIKRKKRRKQALLAVVIVIASLGVAAGVSRLKPAAPSVERSTVWTDTVKRGNMVRQVRGIGSLVPSPEFVRQIPAETEATVVRIRVLAGTQVQADTVLVELSNPTTEQAAVDAELQEKAAEAELASLKVKLQSDLLTQKAGAATVEADMSQAQLEAETDKELVKLGVLSNIAYKAQLNKASELNTRNGLEIERLKINKEAIQSQVAVQEAKVDQMRTLAQLKRKQLDDLKVRAGIPGVLVDLPLQVGQHVMPGVMLAKVVQPDHLIAELKIPETQARDVQISQPAEIDTHNGVVAGTVMRVDPAVQNGTVTVDVRLVGEPPKGARPDLSVDGTIDLQRLNNVLFVGRPAFGQENSTVGIFRVDPDGKGAVRVPVKVGVASVNTIEILEGAHEGDTLILSDMSRWDNTDRVRLE